MNRNTAIACIIIAAVIIIGLIKGGQRDGGPRYRTEPEDGINLTPLHALLPRHGPPEPYEPPASQPAASTTQPSPLAVGKRFASKSEMTDAVMALKPDAGSIVIFGEMPQADESKMTGFVIEKGFGERARYLVFREREGTYTLIDDFEDEGGHGVSRVLELNGQLIFFTSDGRTPLIRTLEK